MKIAITLTTTGTIRFDDDTRIREIFIYYNIMKTLLEFIVGGINREEESVILEMK